MYTIGPHTSIAGGLQNAALQASELKATAFGMFTKNQRQWKSKPITEEEASLFKTTLGHLGYGPSQVLPHDSYLINLGNPDSEKRRISLEAFIDEVKRVHQLGLDRLNFHPGSHLNAISAEESMLLIAESINTTLEETEGVTAVLENTAGQGSNLGSTFEELAFMLDHIKRSERVGICLDTCHLFAAGYDVATEEGFGKTFERFDSLIGFSRLRGMHLNDAKAPLASHLDRHESLGKGTIGWICFERIASDPRFENLPMILETIDPSVWKDEIAHLLGTN